MHAFNSCMHFIHACVLFMHVFACARIKYCMYAPTCGIGVHSCTAQDLDIQSQRHAKMTQKNGQLRLPTRSRNNEAELNRTTHTTRRRRGGKGGVDQIHFAEDGGVQGVEVDGEDV